MADSDLVTIQQSNLPLAAKKSAIRRWYEGFKGGGIEKVKSHAVEAGHAVRAGGESLLMGGILGFAHAEMPTGLDVDGVPIDGIIGGLGLLGAVALANTGVAPDARNIGSTAIGILAFRKAHDYHHEKKLASGEATGAKISKPSTFQGVKGGAANPKVAGEFGAGEEDPIVAAARSL